MTKETIINKMNYSRWAVDELWADSFMQKELAPINVAKEKMDYADFVHDIQITNIGVLFPTEYDIDGKVVSYEVAFTKAEHEAMVRTLIAENEPAALNEYINVQEDKN